jgi:type IV secretory pathway TrbF-like protein
MNDRSGTPRTSTPLLPFSKEERRKTDSEAVMAMHHLAQKRWNEEFGGFIHEKKVWQRVAMISLALNILAVAGMAYIGAQNKMVPYVVEVDKLGAAVAVQRADIPMVANAASIKAHLARWIQNTRSIYLDVAAEKQALKEAYASINNNGPASGTLNDYFQQHEPFKQAENESVSVQVESVQPISDKTWRIEWQEDHRARDGRLVTSLEQQATVSIVISPPTDEATILVNPLGIYIDSFSWSQRL